MKSSLWQSANPLKYPLMALTVFIYGFCVSVSWPFVALFGVNELKVSSSETAFLISAVAISGLAFSHIIGILSDKLHDRRIALWLVLVCSIVGCLVFAFVRNYWWIFLCCCTFLGVGAASFAQIFAMAREQFESDGLGEIDVRNNTLRGIFSLSWVFGPAIGSIIISTLGYAVIFVVAAIGYSVLVLLVFMVKRKNQDIEHEEKHNLVRKKYTAKIYLNVVSFALLNLALNICTIAYPLLINKTHELSEKFLGFLMGATALLEIPLMISVALLAKKLDKGRIVLAGFLVFSIYCGILFVADSLFLLFVAQAICAIAVAIIMGLGMSFCQDLLPGQAGEGTTLFTNASLAGSVASGLVFAFAATIINYQQIYLLCSVLCLFGSLMFFISNFISINRTLALPNESIVGEG